MTLIDLINEFCDRRGLDQASSVIGTVDPTIRQLKGLCNEVVADIVKRPGAWARLQKQGSFTSVASEDQGAMSTMAPSGFKFIIPETLFDRTNGRQLFGPRSAPQWQENKALVYTGPFYTFRVWQDHFWVQPTMPAGLNIYFEYSSDYGILAADGTTYKARFTVDTDTFVLDDDLLLKGLEWKWRREKGLAYTQEFDDFEFLLTNTLSRQSTAGVLGLAGQSDPQVSPGVMVPLGNWNV
jgi:hypothetical protein